MTQRLTLAMQKHSNKQWSKEISPGCTRRCCTRLHPALREQRQWMRGLREMAWFRSVFTVWFHSGSRCGFAVVSHRFAVVSHSFAVVSRWFRGGFAQFRTVSRWFRMLRPLRGCFRMNMHINFTCFTAVSRNFTYVAHCVTA